MLLASIGVLAMVAICAVAANAFLEEDVREHISPPVSPREEEQTQPLISRHRTPQPGWEMV